MITHSGAQVWLDGSPHPQGGAPSIADIARGLGRVSRFGGQSPTYYTVLPHTMVVADLVAEEFRTFALMHDCAESMLGDVPAPLKDQARRDLEDNMTERIFRKHGLEWPMPQEAADAVKTADLDAMVAEARLLGLWDLTPAHEAYWGVFPLTDGVEYAMELTRRHLMKATPLLWLDGDKAVAAFEGALER